MTSSFEQKDAVQRVKDAAQIVDIIGECISLKRAGANMKGLCPFHAEKTPSFMVNPARQSFHCFGCGEGGDILSFMMKYYNLTFPEALKHLAQRYHITLPEKQFSSEDRKKAEKRQKLFDVNERAARMYHEYLLNRSEAAQAREYLHKREIPSEIINNFQLGYAPESWDFLSNKVAKSSITLAEAEEAGLLVRKNSSRFYDRFRDRILFPIHELTGRVVGFGGRILCEGEPKYLNSPETLIFDKSRMLFGLYKNRDAIRKARKAVIVEGNFDLLTLVSHGLDNVVAPLGTALTQSQIRLLKGYADEVILLFDGDEAGIKAAMRAVPLFLAEQVTGRVALLPAMHDPDTYIRAHGREKLEKYLDSALPILEFAFEHLKEKHGTSITGKGKILQELEPLIQASGSSPFQQSVLISEFSNKLGLDPEQVMRGFKTAARKQTRAGSIRPAARPEETMKPETQKQLPRQQAQLLEFLIFYPRFFSRFLEAGIEEILVENPARNILEVLHKLSQEEELTGPEQLMESLAEGPERSYISRLLISSPFLGQDDPEVIEKMAEEMLVWLVRYRFKKEINQLSEEIRSAQEKKNSELLEELLHRKAELNKYLASMNIGDS
ncbi:MAG: DNA primase [Deltaproteobacteria bacterium]|jgi:DNA primase|nr:DNA primase [Deltaproteobacteria bacterium]